MEPFAVLHAESFNKVSNVVESDGHNGDIAAHKD